MSSVSSAPASRRWSARVKESFVLALLRGDLTFAAAITDTGASDAEIARWVHHHGARGRRGLETTRAQDPGLRLIGPIVNAAIVDAAVARAAEEIAPPQHDARSRGRMADLVPQRGGANPNGDHP